MKWMIAGALSAAVVGGSGAALAQPYVYYPPVYHYGYYADNDWRYYDNWRHDNGRHRGWYKQRRHRYYGYPYRQYYYGYAPTRVCAWRYGERVCWWVR